MEYEAAAQATESSTEVKAKKKSWFDKYNDLPKPLQKGKYLFIILGTLIPVIEFFVFYVGVNATSILLAFQKTQFVNGVEVTSWTLGNFVDIFKAFGKVDGDFFIAWKNTAVLWCVDALMIIPVFLIAYGFSKDMPGAKMFRIMLYIPSIISATAFGVMITSILQANVGALPVMLKKIGVDVPPLLTSYEHAYSTVIGYCVWAGFYANNLLFEGAIRRIPKEVVEAAQLDGANKFQEIFHITVPMVWGTLSTILILKVSAIFTITGPILTLTNGAYNTQTLNFWFYKSVAVDGSYNMPAAGGIVLTLFALPIVFGFRALINRVNADIEY